jgi:uncharacterized protein YaeQ
VPADALQAGWSHHRDPQDGSLQWPTPRQARQRMALKSTVHKAELSISDMDRHYYATHALTLAQHPSETDQRLMVRLLAFALFADERLAFGRGLSSDDEPDLWRHARDGQIEQWIELGQPDEARVRRACGRARQVVVLGYAGRAFSLWWDKQRSTLARCGNLDVIELPADCAESLTALFARSMRLQCLIEDGELQLMGDAGSVAVRPQWLQAAETQAPR